jgi:SAM-dependent methyltransferase
MDRCPICSSKIRPGFYRFHQRSFLDKSYWHGLSPTRSLDICETCFYVAPEFPFFEFAQAPLKESFITLRGKGPRSDVAYEMNIGKRILRVLGKAPGIDIKGIGSVLDLRALSGGVLELMQEHGVGTLHTGLDFLSNNVKWSESCRDVRLSLWGEQFEKANTGFGIDFSEADLVYSSRPILELCSAPGTFLEAIKRTLSPRGLCLFRERDLSAYPQTIFLNELFTPWGNSFFTNNNLRYLLLKHGFEIVAEERENNFVYFLVRQKHDKETASNPLHESILRSFRPNPYLQFPRYEETNKEKCWQGKIGFLEAGVSMLLTMTAEKSNLDFDIPVKQRLCASTPSKSPIRSRSVEQKYLDVIVVSCGRKKELERTLKTFQKLVVSEGRKFRFLIHDDMMEGREEEHEECRQYIRQSKVFSKMLFEEKNVGIGESIKALLQEVETEYYFHLEDDFFFLRMIYLDPLIEIFNQYEEVNYIRFYSRETTPNLHTVTRCLGDVRSRQYLFNGQILTLAPFWSHQANIARMDSPFVRLVQGLSGRFRERMCNVELLKDCINHEDVYEKMGTFIYGPLYQARVVYHCYDVSTRDLMLKRFPDDRKATVDDFRATEDE